jgi:uncharacterized protein Smg (DUF494 family)
MIDILVYLFENYHDFSARPKTKTLKRRLSAVGFEQEAITTALSWLDGLKATPVIEHPGDQRALRIYLPEEQRRSGYSRSSSPFGDPRANSPAARLACQARRSALIMARPPD